MEVSCSLTERCARRFYVGCDLCANWFHGDCVGITETASRTMTEYVCDDCSSAKINKELFCFCRKVSQTCLDVLYTCLSLK